MSDVLDQAHGYNFMREDGEIDQNFVQNLLPKLVPKLMEVFTDPSVIKEITQHEINSRSQEPNLGSMQRNEQYLMCSIFQTSPDIENGNLEEGKLLNLPYLGADASDETEDWKSCSSSTTTRRKVILGVPEKSSKYLKNKRMAYACIIAAVFVLAIVLAGSLTIFFLWLAVNSGSILILDQLYNTCNGLLTVSVKSLDEYNSALETGGKQKLSIFVELDRANDWPTGVSLHSSNNINDIRLSGPFHAKKLTSLLSTISKLEKLHLNNKNNLMCTESIPPIKTFDVGKTVNISVGEFILERFDPLCTKALEIIHDSMEFHNIEIFRLISGVINAENVGIFEKLLERYKNTLKRLEIIDSSFRAEIFSEEHSLTFENVNELVLDSMQGNESTNFTPLHNICRLFPNVQKLSFGAGLTQWNNIKNVYDCKQLKSLQIKIWIQPSDNNFSLSFLSERFPKLEGAEISLLFGTTLPSSEMICADKIKKIDGRKDLSKLLLANLRITSNCKLTF